MSIPAVSAIPRREAPSKPSRAKTSVAAASTRALVSRPSERILRGFSYLLPPPLTRREGALERDVGVVFVSGFATLSRLGGPMEDPRCTIAGKAPQDERTCQSGSCSH